MASRKINSYDHMLPKVFVEIKQQMMEAHVMCLPNFLRSSKYHVMPHASELVFSSLSGK